MDYHQFLIGLPLVPSPPLMNNISYPRSVADLSSLPVTNQTFSKEQGLSMVGLPLVPTSPAMNLPKNLGKFTYPRSPMEGLPPVPDPPLSPVSPKLPKQYLSVSVPTHRVWKDMKPESHIESILSLPVYDVPSLEEVLKKTRQPFLQEQLKKMIETQKQYEGKGIRTRGWREASPKKGRDRHQLMDECGDACFLRPETEGFPIYPKCQLGNGKCRGLQSAKIRADQWGYPKVEDMANKILESKYKDLSSFLPRIKIILISFI